MIKLKAYGIAALGAWITDLQFVSGTYIELKPLAPETNEDSWGMEVKIAITEEPVYVMAFVMNGWESPEATLKRCLPHGRIVSDRGHLHSERYHDSTEGRYYYEPYPKLLTTIKSRVSKWTGGAQTEYLDPAILGCWKLSLSHLKDLQTKKMLARMNDHSFHLNADAFIDLAPEGVYSFEGRVDHGYGIYTMQASKIIDGDRSFTPGDKLVCKYIQFGSLMALEPDIKISFSNNVMKFPQDFYDSHMAYVRSSLYEISSDKYHKVGRPSSTAHTRRPTTCRANDCPKHGPFQGLDLKEIRFWISSGDEDERSYVLDTKDLLIAEGERLGIYLSDDDAFYLGPRLLRAFSISVDTRGGTKKYKSVPKEEARHTQRGASTSE
ncbi:hypothetical protein ABG067_005414 [Albugo candida]